MNIEQIKSLRSAISPTPWNLMDDPDHPDVEDKWGKLIATGWKIEDAEFIAATPEMIDFLLETVDKLTKYNGPEYDPKVIVDRIFKGTEQ